MNKKEKKSIIGEVINLAGGRFKDEEVDLLYDVVTNPEEYMGRKKVSKSTSEGICSDGKYTRDEEREYTIGSKEGKVVVDFDYRYEDDDGESGSSHRTYETGREIVSVLRNVFKIK